ncbi:hypothetical protein [Leptolyngbya ohadii]|nr:hypothetical protein [Leptolyngbya ohadii]
MGGIVLDGRSLRAAACGGSLRAAACGGSHFSQPRNFFESQNFL